MGWRVDKRGHMYTVRYAGAGGATARRAQGGTLWKSGYALVLVAGAGRQQAFVWTHDRCGMGAWEGVGPAAGGWTATPASQTHAKKCSIPANCYGRGVPAAVHALLKCRRGLPG